MSWQLSVIGDDGKHTAKGDKDLLDAVTSFVDALAKTHTILTWSFAAPNAERAPDEQMAE